jgi:signal transduction histidine kinase
MFIPASSEFVALCQSQVAVLTQGMGAALSAVYLTEELVEGAEAKLIPVAVYPEAEAVWEEEEPNLVLPEAMDEIDTVPRLSREQPRLLPQAFDYDPKESSTSADWEEKALQGQRQIVLPLMHEGVVMGLLVTGREDRLWNEPEKANIKRIAQTLSLAYVIEQRRAWLEQQSAQQQRLRLAQRDRLDDLLHQFRNPLTALRTFGKLLIKRLLPGDKNYDAASSIMRESDRLQELLQEFDECLDMNLEDLAPPSLPGTVDVRPPVPTPPNSLLPRKALTLEPVSVTAVLEPLVVSARAVAQERDLDLSASIPAELPSVLGNAKALREILSNLIDNALKYTPAGGAIAIEASVQQKAERGEMLAIAISDTGPGIPPEDREHLFERHYRGVQAETAIPGSGLGLAIAKELIEQMQGDIEVYSPARSHRATQVGTTFVVWLPLA